MKKSVITWLTRNSHFYNKMLLSSIFKFGPTAKICPKLALSATPLSIFLIFTLRALGIVRAEYRLAAITHRSPDHGKIHRNFHVEFVGNYSFIHSQIEKLQSRPETLKIWWVLMKNFHVKFVGHWSLVHLRIKNPYMTRKPHNFVVFYE